ncbi:MFS transporter [Aneurinibacillus aneurinilyticus]|uniref:Transporter, major facilitator family protein n=1 Tax=Aneurinibacillus aneurinilyticus ATCC 12856 TaxID=649747 RepID=U1X0A7_ANEAE|nr:MFS transporter [Aneurinibacillus aneurinilyticus]ERI08410.1 transporter, major facilitator family protein [Aneurinibacillus aneurinilyticus ATCC 12856]MED0704585.1 MFS transporter [Aneurinibacillus aneurinilyticus]MED0725204.1 MFS transporter [Aneurinibacillus aneurinilyticus]MED0735053.1 MFS transporter [Aneurinibacillus aneurinilyticus]MED0742470.1 MFS transporter [Aneurinibacillus aneurinilyticus]
MEIWKRNLYILWFAQFMVLAAMNLVIPFLPLFLQHDLGVSDPVAAQHWTGWIFAANFLTAFLVAPLWGKLSDKTGRKAMLLRSGIGMSLVTLCMGFVTSPVQLLALRLLNGLISGFVPAAVALVSTNTPKEKAGYALGLLQSGAVAGTILGPLLGGLLAEWVSFRDIFRVTGLLLFGAAMLVLLFVREVNKPQPKLKAELLPNEETGLRRIIHTSPLPGLFLTGFLIQFAMMSTNPFMSSYVQELWPGGAFMSLMVGIVISASGISTMLFSPLLGKWGDKIGPQYVLLICLIGTVVFFIPQGLVNSIWPLIVLRFMLGMCIGGLIPSVNNLIRKHAPEGMESQTFAYSTSAMNLGNLLGPIVGGALSGVIGLHGLFFMAATLFLMNTMWVKYTLHRAQSPRTLLSRLLQTKL